MFRSMRRMFLPTVCVSLNCLLFVGCAPTERTDTPSASIKTGDTALIDSVPLSWEGATMGATYNVKAVVPRERSDLTLMALHEEVEAELRSVTDQMSTYLKTSEISRFNQSESTDWFPVSAPFAACVAYALLVSEQTDGAFDITVAPLVDVWTFGPASQESSAAPSRSIPSAEQLERIRQQVGYQHLSARLEPPAIKKDIPAIRIDLNALAPGQAVDRVVDKLIRLGVTSCLVEIGGEVRAVGERSGGGAWRVGIERPTSHDGNDDQEPGLQIEQVVPLLDRALATSGDYRKFFIDPVTSERYSHTIDPHTGYPVKHSLASVSILADTCMEADAWATALNVLGLPRGRQLAEERGFDVLWIERAGDEFKVQGIGSLEPGK